MYLRDIQLRNLKLIRDLKLDFTRAGAPRMWTVLLAENGHCKTAILQAIALVASGETRANQLADVSALPDRRQPKERMTLSGTFQLAPAVEEWVEVHGEDARLTRLYTRLSVTAPSQELRGTSRLLTERGHGEDPPLRPLDHPSELLKAMDEDDIQRADAEYERFMARDPLRDLRARNEPNWLVVGYGTSRVLPEPETSPVPSDPARNRLASLFGRAAIVGTDFLAHLATHDQTLVKPFVAELNAALLAEPDLLPAVDRFERRGQGGVRTPRTLIQAHRFGFLAGRERVTVPATWLSQGYQSTIAWVADLVGQAFWDTKKPVRLADMTGLVLIDELDLHLHPRWQVNLVRTLKRVFPRMQFVVTTHSPMLLPGLEADEVVRLGTDEEGNIVQLPQGPPPRLMTGTDLYARYFGVTDFYPDDLGKALMRYGTLSGDPGRSPREEEELHRLRAVLAAAGVDPGWEPVAIDPDLQREDQP